VAEAPQGHSSLSGRPGVRNAGVDAARLVVAVADELRLPVPPDPGLAGWEVTVNPGLAWRGGVGPGVLPGVLRVDTDVRVLPGMAQEAVVGAFAELAAAVAARTGATLRVERDAPPVGWLPAAQVATADPLAVAARAACAATFGAAPRYAVFPGTTDATWLADAYCGGAA
jgi:succinyl-diaminopimelate desuccinylase